MILTRTDLRWMEDQRRNAALRHATAANPGIPAGTGRGHAGPLPARTAAAALCAAASRPACDGPASDRSGHPA